LTVYILKNKRSLKGNKYCRSLTTMSTISWHRFNQTLQKSSYDAI